MLFYFILYFTLWRKLDKNEQTLLNVVKIELDWYKIYLITIHQAVPTFILHVLVHKHSQIYLYFHVFSTMDSHMIAKVCATHFNPHWTWRYNSHSCFKCDQNWREYWKFEMFDVSFILTRRGRFSSLTYLDIQALESVKQIEEKVFKKSWAEMDLVDSLYPILWSRATLLSK